MKINSLLFLVTLLAPALSNAQAINDSGTPQASTFRAFGERAVVGTGSFTGSEATMSPRFFRSGTPGGACSTFSSGDFQFLEVPMFTDGTGSVTATFDPATCGTGIFVTFHTPPFNPASICDGYVWSFGSSQAFTETFAVTPNSPLTMVVSGVANAPGVACGPFSYDIQGANAQVAGPSRPVPAMSATGLAMLAGLVAVMAGLFAFRRRG